MSVADNVVPGKVSGVDPRELPQGQRTLELSWLLYTAQLSLMFSLSDLPQFRNLEKAKAFPEMSLSTTAFLSASQSKKRLPSENKCLECPKYFVVQEDQ